MYDPNDYYLTGEANVEKIEEHGVIKKSYGWESPGSTEVIL